MQVEMVVRLTFLLIALPCILVAMRHVPGSRDDPAGRTVASSSRLRYGVQVDDSDLITSLPGQPDVPFLMRSGYVEVEGSQEGRALFYWFVEADVESPSSAPLTLWLNGGPGCSSVGGGAMSELGPFYPTTDGKSLQKNPYSWNKVSNLLFIESPAGVGFSYFNSTVDVEVGDRRSADDVYECLLGFFKLHPQYASNDFYIAGESYGGHYVPQLANTILDHNKMLPGGTAPIKLKGFMAGNAWTDATLDNVGALLFWWTHSIVSTATFVEVLQSCNFTEAGPLKVAQLRRLLDAASPRRSREEGGPSEEECETAVDDALIEMGYGRISIYDIYGDVCLERTSNDATSQQNLTPAARQLAMRMARRGGELGVRWPGQLVGAAGAAGPDACIDNQVEAYLNLPAVQAALHVRNRPHKWTDCSDTVENIFSRGDLLTSVLPLYRDHLLPAGLRGLIYSGDVDAIVPTTGTRSWLRRLNLPVLYPWRAWVLDQQVGGYVVGYENLTFASVKGAGHFVPYTQPSRALALFTSFIQGMPLASSSGPTAMEDMRGKFPLQVHPKPPAHFEAVESSHKTTKAGALKGSSYRPFLTQEANVTLGASHMASDTSKPAGRRWKGEDDLVTLPGQPKVAFKTWSGYVTVNEEKGRALFYWLVEADVADPESAPLTLWLSGGPLCSSIGYGAFSEIGPFRASSDGQSLELNPYSWNHASNLLFLESPAGVGFSYFNSSEDSQVGDKRTAVDTYSFLVGFLEKYPVYTRRPLFIAGESYGGHYVPQLAELIVAGNADSSDGPHINLQGFAVGNPLTDLRHDIAGIITYIWSHDLVSDETFKNLGVRCNYLPASTATSPEDPIPGDGVSAVLQIMSSSGTDPAWRPDEECLLAFQRARKEMGDPFTSVYDIYAATCPRRSAASWQLEHGSGALNGHHVEVDVGCATKGITAYLNRKDVQSALHVREGSPQAWAVCNHDMDYSEEDVFSSVLPSYRHLLGHGLRILVYSGDADSVIPALGTRMWLSTLQLAEKESWRPWLHQGQVGGYVEEYEGLTFVTVREAGHFVAWTEPSRALAMFTSFISGTSL